MSFLDSLGVAALVPKIEGGAGGLVVNVAIAQRRPGFDIDMGLAAGPRFWKPMTSWSTSPAVIRLCWVAAPLDEAFFTSASEDDLTFVGKAPDDFQNFLLLAFHLRNPDRPA